MQAASSANAVSAWHKGHRQHEARNTCVLAADCPRTGGVAGDVANRIICSASTNMTRTPTENSAGGKYSASTKSRILEGACSVCVTHVPHNRSFPMSKVTMPLLPPASNRSPTSTLLVIPANIGGVRHKITPRARDAPIAIPLCVMKCATAPSSWTEAIFTPLNQLLHSVPSSKVSVLRTVSVQEGGACGIPTRKIATPWSKHVTQKPDATCKAVTEPHACGGRAAAASHLPEPAFLEGSRTSHRC